MYFLKDGNKNLNFFHLNQMVDVAMLETDDSETLLDHVYTINQDGVINVEVPKIRMSIISQSILFGNMFLI